MRTTDKEAGGSRVFLRAILSVVFSGRPDSRRGAVPYRFVRTRKVSIGESFARFGRKTHEST